MAFSKLAGERWCEYYFEKYGVDVRSIRYPGLIGWKASPGGGTTDYAVHIFHEALKKGSYKSFLFGRNSPANDVYGRCHQGNYQPDGCTCRTN
jgi:nucleoside-diphosphate-sugar epimerase